MASDQEVCSIVEVLQLNMMSHRTLLTENTSNYCKEACLNAEPKLVVNLTVTHVSDVRFIIA